MKNMFDAEAFKKARLPFMLIMMAPSFAVDALLIYRLFTLDPAMTNSLGKLDTFEILSLFAVNFIFFKGYALVIYFLLRYVRSKSSVTLYKDKVIFHKRRLVMSEAEYDYAYFVDYEITDIKQLIFRKSGAVEARGGFAAQYLCDDKTEHHRGRSAKVVIPPYFLNMQKIKDRLSELTNIPEAR